MSTLYAVTYADSKLELHQNVASDFSPRWGGTMVDPTPNVGAILAVLVAEINDLTAAIERLREESRKCCCCDK